MSRSTRPTGRYHIQTWGCQMNVHDSERMAGLLQGLGFGEASNEEEADLVLLNTCTVRENAAAKVAGKLGDLKTLKRKKEHLIVGVCGCLAQQEQDALFAGAPHLDLVLGPRAIPQLPKHVQRIVDSREHVADTAPWTETIGEGSETCTPDRDAALSVTAASAPPSFVSPTTLANPQSST